MALSDAQLTTWSKIGATQSSSETYQQIKSVLESYDAPYFWKTFEVFLQGSYKNDTHIFSESDVDIVIELTSPCVYNLDSLSPRLRIEILPTIKQATIYDLDKFKQDVFSHLKEKFGTDVSFGKRAINIKAKGTRRS